MRLIASEKKYHLGIRIMLGSTFFYRSIFLRTTAATLLVALLNGCAGVHEKQLIARIDKNDESGLFYDVTKKKYSKSENYKNHNINKHDVVNAWGIPVSVIKNNFTEMWVYERKMFFGATWILVPIPIIAWPAGYYETRVHFREDQVVYVSREHGDFEIYPEIRLH